MIRKAVYAGSFDPPTHGHMFMIREGARLFDELVVAVGVNPDKRVTFDVPTRLELLRNVTAHLGNVTVSMFENQFLVRYAAQIGAQSLLRGMRSSSDFEFEKTMRQVNADMEPGISTVYLIPPRALIETSSSFVKGLVGPDGWEGVVKDFVPPPVYERLLDLYRVKSESGRLPEQG